MHTGLTGLARLCGSQLICYLLEDKSLRNTRQPYVHRIALLPEFSATGDSIIKSSLGTNLPPEITRLLKNPMSRRLSLPLRLSSRQVRQEPSISRMSEYGLEKVYEGENAQVE